MKIRSSKLTFFLIILLCLASYETSFAKKRRRRRKYRGVIIKKVEPKPPKPDTVIIKDTLPAPVTVPVSEWAGKKFRLLEKTKMFQKYGYELYTSPLFSEDTTPADPRIAHKNHRLKYKVFNRATVIATAVKKMADGEYHITFKANTPQLTVYGKTRKGIIEGLALYGDFEAAEKRWKGKTIFSRRRSIETYDSAQSCFTSDKISVTEPLKVIAIRWGITPLPPKSLWLVIVRPGGFKGFIPINYSWTNVLQTEKTVSLPWEKDIFEQDPRKLFKWEEYIWETIDKHNICTGMTTEQVRFSWGKPKEIKTKKSSDGKEITTYKYSGKMLKFENDTLRSTVE